MAEDDEVMIDAFADEEPAPAEPAPKEPPPPPEEPPKSVEPAPQPAEPEPTPPQPKTVPEAAFLEVRRKLKEAEATARQRGRQIEQMQAPDPDENPEEFAQYVQAKAAVDSIDDRVNLSRELMMDTHSDFEEMEQVFIGMLRDDAGNMDQAMVAQMQASPNPAKFAYTKAKQHLEYQRFLEERDPAKQAEREAEMEARIRAKVMADLGIEQPKQSEGVSATEVPDLTLAAGAGARTEPLASAEEQTISDVFSEPYTQVTY